MIRKTDPQTIAPYLRDASNFSSGNAEEVVIPESRGELVAFLKENQKPITVAGAGTGLTASRIPYSGIIVSLERFDRIGDIEDSTISVGPAVRLRDLQAQLRGTPYFYPPNPTETLASIGGTVATNASGSRSRKFGVTRDYVVEVDVLLADGRTVSLPRGISIKEPLVMDDGTRIEFPEITYVSPTCKNTAGYYARPGMDWLDLFIGSDGTLGIFAEIKLRLADRPADFISGVLFFDAEESCWNLLESIRSTTKDLIDPCSLEYFDRRSLIRLREKYPNIPERAHAALFFEQDVPLKESYDPILDDWFALLSEREVMLDDSWFAQNDRDVRRFHEFRHEIPVLINEEIHRRGLVKIGTDMAVDDAHFMEMMLFYRRELEAAEMEYCVFGHLGDNHVHINLLPQPEEVDKAKAIYRNLTQQILSWNGTVAAEHGIGKIKKPYLAQMVGEQALLDFKRIKKALDPDFKLGAGNLY